MALDKIIEKLRTLAKKLDVSGVDFLAVQVNLTDLDPGVFYVEIKNGEINIEPYAYNDRSCAVSISSADFQKLLNGKLNAVAAYTTGKLKVEGDMGKALEFANLLKK